MRNQFIPFLRRQRALPELVAEYCKAFPGAAATVLHQDRWVFGGKFTVDAEFVAPKDLRACEKTILSQERREHMPRVFSMIPDHCNPAELDSPIVEIEFFNGEVHWPVKKGIKVPTVRHHQLVVPVLTGPESFKGVIGYAPFEQFSAIHNALMANGKPRRPGAPKPYTFEAIQQGDGLAYKASLLWVAEGNRRCVAILSLVSPNNTRMSRTLVP